MTQPVSVFQLIFTENGAQIPAALAEGTSYLEAVKMAGIMADQHGDKVIVIRTDLPTASNTVAVALPNKP